jgi:sugar lactone lactonase YvrE
MKKRFEGVPLSLVGTIWGILIVLLFLTKAPGQNLFVTGLNGNLIQITTKGVQLTNASALNNPSGLAFDKSGNLFIANFSADDILKMTPTGMVSTYAQGLDDAYNVAFDSTGNLYVAGGTIPSEGYITRIAPNGTQTPFASALSQPYGVAFDSTGNLFEADAGTGDIFEFTTAGVQSLFASGFGTPYGLAFDTQGDLFAADFSSNSIVEFTNSNGTLSANPAVFATGLHGPVGLAFDNSGNLFVANYGNNSITEIAPDGTETTFASGLNDYLFGLAIQPLPKLQNGLVKGGIRLNVMTPSPYYSTVVQISSNLVNWSDFYTNTSSGSFTNFTTGTALSRYYRARLGP